MDAVGGLLLIIVVLAIYFLPTIVAINRNREPLGIGLLNLFLGWTFIGWLGALIWSATGPNRAPTNANPYVPPELRTSPAAFAPNAPSTSPPPPAPALHPLVDEASAPLFRTKPASLDGQGRRISGRMFKKATNLGLSVGSGSDDGAGDIKQGNATEPAIAHLAYEYAQGEMSQRLITLRRMTASTDGERCMVAYCHMREALRTFRVDRILSLTDVTTGEVLDTPETIDKWLDERTPKDMSAALDGLTVLCFVAASDDHISDEEVSIMARYAANAVPGASVPPDFAARLARFAPTPEAVLTSLVALIDRGHVTALENAIADLVTSDDNLHPAEIEALKFIKMTIVED